MVFRGTEGATLTIIPIRGDAVELPLRFSPEMSYDFTTPRGGSTWDAIFRYSVECEGTRSELCYFSLGFFKLRAPVAAEASTRIPVPGPFAIRSRSWGVVHLNYCELLARFLPASAWQIRDHNFAVSDGAVAIDLIEGMALVGRLQGRLQARSSFSFQGRLQQLNLEVCFCQVFSP